MTVIIIIIIFISITRVLWRNIVHQKFIVSKIKTANIFLNN